MDEFVVIAGPCAIENYKTCSKVAKQLKTFQAVGNTDIYFKSSFDKANRTHADSFRGLGFERGLEILERIKKEFCLKICTDIHEPWQADRIKDVVDMIQIPAFLCRQTDLLRAAAKTNLPVTVKKGQFLSPFDMANVIAKLEKFGVKDCFSVERGSSFGYNNLVVDFRGLVIMRRFSKVIFDATHSTQQPGGHGSESGGEKEFAIPLLKAAVVIGIDGMFMEVHPDPSNAKSDKDCQMSIEEFIDAYRMVMELRSNTQ